MSVRINEACVTCGACLWECPTEAIAPGDPRPVVDQDRCTECYGAFGESQCMVVCPADAIVVQPEPREALESKFRRVLPGREPQNTWLWGRMATGGRLGAEPMMPSSRPTPGEALVEGGVGPSSFDARSVLSRNPEVIWDRVDGEMLVCETRTGQFYTLNEVGAYIWESLDGIPGDDLMRKVSDAFSDSDKTPIIRAVEEFLQFLREAGLVDTAARLPSDCRPTRRAK